MGRGADEKRMWALEVIPLTLQSRDFARVQPCQKHWSWVLTKREEEAVKA